MLIIASRPALAGAPKAALPPKPPMPVATAIVAALAQGFVMPFVSSKPFLNPYPAPAIPPPTSAANVTVGAIFGKTYSSNHPTSCPGENTFL